MRCRRCKGRGVVPTYRRRRGQVVREGDAVCPACSGLGSEPEQAESLRDFRRRVIDTTRNRLQDS